MSEIPTPYRFHQGTVSWDEYLAALLTLDSLWRANRYERAAFGVFGAKPSWEDTVARGAALFELESWIDLDADQLSLLAPAATTGADALLGSIGRRSRDVRALVGSPENVSDLDLVLSLAKVAQSLPGEDVPEHGGDLFARMCEIRGVGSGFASRVLTLARPDAFVVLNAKSREWFQAATGMRLAGKRRTYSDLLRWIAEQDWHLAPQPAGDFEQRAWTTRAALIDAFAYQPWT